MTIDLTTARNRIMQYYDLLYHANPQHADLEDIQNWNNQCVDYFIVLNKQGNNYNYMKTIQASFHEFIELVPQVTESQLGSQTFIDSLLNASLSETKSAFEKLEFNLNFFRQLNYFSDNIVAIGANGSGKTSLANSLRENLNHNGLVISAQRVLFIPELDSLPSHKIAEEKWLAMNKKSRTFKDFEDFLEIKEEFGYVLGNLIAKHYKNALNYYQNSIGGQSVTNSFQSELETALRIWNTIFDYRSLELSEDLNLRVHVKNDQTYEPIKMSEGEKSSLYLICQVIQAPKDGFVIIDEPEMYLHKTIITKLWDQLEACRKDCIFIYLTHDLDFATSRTDAKKVWLKSFIYPLKWDIQEIPNNEIPESLFFELLGSRKNILFCESEKGQIDEKVFKILFPQYTIVPVESCRNVINFTKAYNKIPIVNTRAFGIIDSDYHDPDVLNRYAKCDVYNFQMAEIENIFLQEDFLKDISEKLYVDDVALERLKESVLNELEKDKVMQASKYISSRINDYFKDSHIHEGQNMQEVHANYEEFKDKIEIEAWFSERLSLIEQIINSKDYSRAISIYNNKGLKKLTSRHMKIQSLTDYSLKHLASNQKAKDIIKKVFPQQLL
ncbi:ATP-binding protein [Pedobacter psychrodurus]|uniref:ATP-binding protein n=1 Tax=Pedobacter psychrodurus TaxID=2530456 RepID=A0A4R0Q4A1_9SPHI|nr:AAA family ATPase [Pedobacter psychrodurus]TCD27771.1 ATP-binding protein [Pedobacter psychrodurus]